MKFFLLETSKRPETLFLNGNVWWERQRIPRTMMEERPSTPPAARALERKSYCYKWIAVTNVDGSVETKGSICCGCGGGCCNIYLAVVVEE
jgi:hypothetical protein